MSLKTAARLSLKPSNLAIFILDHCQPKPYWLMIWLLRISWTWLAYVKYGWNILTRGRCCSYLQIYFQFNLEPDYYCKLTLFEAMVLSHLHKVVMALSRELALTGGNLQTSRALLPIPRTIWWISCGSCDSFRKDPYCRGFQYPLK